MNLQRQKQKINKDLEKDYYEIKGMKKSNHMPSPKKPMEKHNKDQISNMIDFMKEYKQMRIQRQEARKFITT